MLGSSRETHLVDAGIGGASRHGGSEKRAALHDCYEVFVDGLKVLVMVVEVEVEELGVA